MNRCWVYGNNISGCSVFGGGRKNELAKFVRFLIFEIFTKVLIK